LAVDVFRRSAPSADQNGRVHQSLLRLAGGVMARQAVEAAFFVIPPPYDRGMAKRKHQRTHHESPAGSRFVTTATLEEAVTAAIYASIGQNDRAYAGHVQRLEDAALGGDAEVIRVLANRLLAAVENAWGNGWQPLDLTHVMVRRTSGAHRSLLLEVIEQQHLKFLRMHSESVNAFKDAPRVHPRWEAQLERLGVASSPVETNPALVNQAPLLLFGERSDEAAGNPTKLIEMVQFSLDLLAAMWTLPKLERLLAPPGEAPSRPTSAASQPIRQAPGNRLDDKILARVRGLLAKAESTTFEEEADALTAKAQELMARHAIDLAMVDASTPHSGGPIARRIHLDDPYIEAKSTLLAIVANENRCRSVFSSTLGFSTVFGFDGDLDMVELLLTSLLTQATSSMVASEKHAEPSGGSRTRSYRQSFLLAFAYRVGERLREATKVATTQATTEMGESVLPVLVDRERQVAGLVDEIFPKVRTKRSTVSSAAGWQAGQAAADRASLRAPGVLPGNH
jgi:Protein of unknown function (DUF2786)